MRGNKQNTTQLDFGWFFYENVRTFFFIIPTQFFFFKTFFFLLLAHIYTDIYNTHIHIHIHIYTRTRTHRQRCMLSCVTRLISTFRHRFWLCVTGRRASSTLCGSGLRMRVSREVSDGGERRGRGVHNEGEPSGKFESLIKHLILLLTCVLARLLACSHTFLLTRSLCSPSPLLDPKDSRGWNENGEEGGHQFI